MKFLITTFQVLAPEWKDLFSEAEREIARARLKEHGCQFP
jgi:hypothetical protein